MPAIVNDFIGAIPESRLIGMHVKPVAEPIGIGFDTRTEDFPLLNVGILTWSLCVLKLLFFQIALILTRISAVTPITLAPLIPDFILEITLIFASVFNLLIFFFTQECRTYAVSMLQIHYLGS